MWFKQVEPKRSDSTPKVGAVAAVPVVGIVARVYLHRFHDSGVDMTPPLVR